MDGMTLVLTNESELFDGRIFVRGQTENPYCSKKLSSIIHNGSDYRFTVPFAHCNVRFEEPVSSPYVSYASFLDTQCRS